MVQPIVVKKEEEELPKTITYKKWLVIKKRILWQLQKEKSRIYVLAKQFSSTLKQCIDCDEIEAERRAYGLAPPLILKEQPNDQDKVKDLKKRLFKCIRKSECPQRDLKNKGMPVVRLPIKKEEHWNVILQAGFVRHNAGVQFVCLSHFRDPSQGAGAKNSALVLKHWLLYQDIPPGAILEIKHETTHNSEGLTSNESDWLNLKALLSEQSTQPVPNV